MDWEPKVQFWANFLLVLFVTLGKPFLWAPISYPHPSLCDESKNECMGLHG